MKYIPLVATLALVFTNLSVHAGIFDVINKAADAVQQVKSTVNSVPSATNSGNDATAPASRDHGPADGIRQGYLLPLELELYPRTEIEERVFNPFDRTSIPLSIPRSGGDGMEAAYNLPIEGKVSMVSMSHREDDSPILIERHYIAWLERQGFSRMVICKTPCKAAPDNSDWARAVDSSERMKAFRLPNEATWIVAKRDNAVAIVGVGRWSSRFGSFVKVIEGAPLDLKAWNEVAKDHTIIPPNPSQAAQ